MTANESGRFTLSVVVGMYTVTISHAGFKEKKIENLNVNGFQQVASARSRGRRSRGDGDRVGYRGGRW
jgi:hypothetical protein